MTKPIINLLVVITLLFSAHSFALSSADKHNINLLVNGGPISVRDAAKNMYHTGETNTEVLDVLAEVLLQNYHKSDNTHIDAMSWASKALGNSRQSRYRSTLEEVAENGAHRKLKKYAKKSLKNLNNDGSKQYKKGSVSLAKLRKGEKSQSTASSNPSKPAKTTANGKTSLTDVKVGMGMSQAYGLAGQPSATTTYQTGKAWIPFNFKGGDSARTAALYKGKGRIIFSNESHYTSSWRVIEVLVDLNETGYP